MTKSPSARATGAVDLPAGQHTTACSFLLSGKEPLAVDGVPRSIQATMNSQATITSYLDVSDAALLTSVGRLDHHAVGELFRRYGTVVLVASGWTEATAAEAEQRTVDVFLDVWKRPMAYAPGGHSTRSHLVRAALHGGSQAAVGLAAARLAKLEGWTYHDVAEALFRPSQQVALLLREQLFALRGDVIE